MMIDTNCPNTHSNKLSINLVGIGHGFRILVPENVSIIDSTYTDKKSKECIKNQYVGINI